MRTMDDVHDLWPSAI